MKSKFMAGAARVSITPHDDWYPLYRGLRPDDNRLAPEQKNSLLTGNLDELYTRALAIKNDEETIVIITMDYIVVPAGEVQVSRVSQALGIPEKNVLIIATHTHNVPTISTRFSGNSISEDFLQFQRERPEEAARQMKFEKLLLDSIVEAAKLAVANLRPARMGIGYADSYINVNRDQRYNGEYHMGYDGAGHSDKTAALIRFEDENGKTIARLANYACHAISSYLNRCGENGAGCTTADYPGLVSCTFEKQDEGSICLWTPGAQGNQNPLFMNFVSFPDPVTGEVHEELLDPGCYQVTTVLGHRHFWDLKKAEQSISAYVDEISLRCDREILQIPIDETKPRNRWHRENNGDYQPVVASGVMLGDICFYGIGGELYSDVGSMLKELSPYKDTLIFTLCIGCGGYMMNDDDLTAPTLFARRTLWKPGYLVPKLSDFLKRFTDK